MKLSLRLSLLMVLLTLLPALPAAWVSYQLVGQSLNLALNPQVDGALQAGVRRAREQFLELRHELEDEVAALLPVLFPAGDNTSPDTVATRLRDWAGSVSDGFLAPGDRILARDAEGREILLRAGDEAVIRGSDADGGPPGYVEASQVLPSGWSLTVRRSLPEAWREDAGLLAETLQVTRGLQAKRHELERGFWLPFIGIYMVALTVGLLLATHLSRGITRPTTRLLAATEEVAAGNWTVEVPVLANDELGRLSARFNEMLYTLGAQSRNLADLEKMAGWREMARALAHEVKNPLTPIQLTVEEMRVRYRGDDDDYRELLDECSRIVVQEVRSLRNVVTRFREFSRPVEPRMEALRINELLVDLAALQKDLHVELDLDSRLGTVEADADRLRQVFMNLAQNTRQATKDLAEGRLRLTSKLAGDWVILHIEDNGPGIPLAERERVFEPYRSGSARGLGLGLALVKGIVLAHKGAISIEDGNLGGACVCIELPRKQPKPTAQMDEMNEAGENARGNEAADE